MGFIVVVLSFVAYGLNFWVYHYPGNNYFPSSAVLAFVILCIFHVGVRLLCAPSDYGYRLSQELILFFIVMAIIALATNAVQYTPFLPIDDIILHWQKGFPWSTEQMLMLTHQYPFLKKLLEFSYASLDYQMGLLPILMIVSKRYNTLRTYYFHLFFTLIFGFICYYFWPTIAPASVLKLSYFSDAQYATGLKFNQIHQHLQPTTIEGGLIAFPSFHTIWAILCLMLVKEFRFLFFALLINNTLLVLSCVLLGWHYIFDVLAGFGLVSASIWFKSVANRQPAKANCDSEIIIARR